jgi:hypothetical protein
LVLRRSADVRVDLFDAVGRRVRAVSEGVLAAGDHPVELDVAGLAPGVYLLRARAGETSVSHRLLVAR